MAVAAGATAGIVAAVAVTAVAGVAVAATVAVVVAGAVTTTVTDPFGASKRFESWKAGDFVENLRLSSFLDASAEFFYRFFRSARYWAASALVPAKESGLPALPVACRHARHVTGSRSSSGRKSRSVSIPTGAPVRASIWMAANAGVSSGTSISQ